MKETESQSSPAVVFANAQEKKSADGHRRGDGSSIGGAADETFSSARGLVSSSKVQKLLDTTINENFFELVLYMKEAVPDFLDGFLPPAGEQPKMEGESLFACDKQNQSTAQRHTAPFSSATTLRSALENRVVGLHTRFLQEWSTLSEVFEEVSDLVLKLQQESEALQTTLNTHAAVAEDFVSLMSTLQAELFLVRQQEKEMREFREKYNFSEEERMLLDSGSVDATYLEILRRAQMTYRKCRELLFSREHYQSAAAMMDITYSAIIKGSEKVARHLISVFATSSGTTSFGGDYPDMTSFCLQCLRFLHEENSSQWVVVVEEVARLRRAAVLRQYFHLMATGSATSATGTYRAGGTKNNNDTATNSSGVRPLEAEIGNPVFFFSSLFAWLHQVIVDEDDFLSAFFPPLSSQEGAETTPTTLSVFAAVDGSCGGGGEKGGVVVAHTQREDAATTDGDLVDENKGAASLLSKASVLDSIFEVLCKHIQGVFDGVLDRLLRCASDRIGSDGGGVSGSSPQFSGPIGLTGGITRLLAAATGRAAPFASDRAGGTRRYQHVRTRAQQEALVAATLLGLTNCFCTAHTLLQLFAYYSCGTFTALLGSGAALTRLVADDFKVQLQRVYHTIAKQLAEHALDSVASVVSRCAVLRRCLASVETAGEVGEIGEGKREAATTFVVQYLFKYATEEEKLLVGCAAFNEDYSKSLNSQRGQEEQLQSSFGGSLSATLNFSSSVNLPYSRTGLSEQHAQLADLVRVLYSMILPVPPEVQQCLRVLQETMVEAEKHAEIMESVRSAPLKSVVQGDSLGTSASASHEQFFTVLVEHLLSFPHVLARHPTLNDALDEPCKLVLQLNTMCALQETLALHPKLLESKNNADSQARPLVDVLSERIRELSRALKAALSASAVRHYFCSTPKSDLIVTVASTNDLWKNSGVNATTVKEEEKTECGQLDAVSVVAQLSEFYSFAAASGQVYVPLIAALQSAKIREEVMREVLEELCNVYNARYVWLLQLEMDEQPGSLHGVKVTDVALPPSFVDDFDPKKLRTLLNLSPKPSLSS